jgi:release factor glutamine methyltransferase
VTADVLDPRPDTETLIESALGVPFNRVLDLGTGSGCIVLSLLGERPAAAGVGTDLSDDALSVAAQNAEQLNVGNQLTFVQSDWFSNVEGPFDLIVSNPPYIAAAEMNDLQPEVRNHEPRMALTDEDDGLSCYRAITSDAMAYLNADGHLMFEIGPTQAAAVSAMMTAKGFAEIRVVQDLDGRDRVVLGQKTAS